MRSHLVLLCYLGEILWLKSFLTSHIINSLIQAQILFHFSFSITHCTAAFLLFVLFLLASSCFDLSCFSIKCMAMRSSMGIECITLLSFVNVFNIFTLIANFSFFELIMQIFVFEITWTVDLVIMRNRINRNNFDKNKLWSLKSLLSRNLALGKLNAEIGWSTLESYLYFY